MSETVHSAFNNVKADENLKERTLQSVCQRLYRQERTPHWWGVPLRRAAVVCGLALVMVSGAGGYRLYNTEAAVISIDINPSVELGINRWGKVVEQTAYGKDGECLLSGLSLKYLEYDEAINRLLSSRAAEIYLKEGSFLSITLGGEVSNQEQLMVEIEQCVDQALTSHHSNVKTAYNQADISEMTQAHQCGISLGKYAAIQELMTVDPAATLEEFQTKTLQQIRDHMASCHGDNHHESAVPAPSEEFVPLPPETTAPPPVHHHARHHGCH